MAAGVALLLSAVLFGWFVHLERRGRRLTVVLTLLAMLTAESAGWPDPNTIPPGLVHPNIGGSNFRLLDTVVLAAIAARVLVRGVAPRVRAVDVCWLLFFGWLVTAGVLGVLQHNDSTLLVYEAKALAYVGTLWVASGVSAAELRGPAVTRFLVAAGLGAAVLLVLDQSGIARPLTLPLLSSPDFGHIGSDGATVFGTLGILALMRALHADTSRFVLLAAAAPLLLSTLAAGQRAALIGALTGLLCCAALTVTSRRPIRLPLGELVVVLLLAAALLAGPLVLSALGTAPRLPLAATVAQALNSRGKQLSAEGRINQWREVGPLLRSRPVEGYGLGKTYSYYEPGPAAFVVSDVTHNIASDLVLRMGLVGLLLFVAAIGTTLRDGVRVARRALDPVLAATALATSGAVAGWLAKGMVESLFEKYRLAVLLGLLVGLIVAMSSTDDSGTGDWDASLVRYGLVPSSAGAAT